MNNRGINYSIAEILSLSTVHWRKLIVFVLAGILLFCGYGLFSMKADKAAETPAAGSENSIEKKDTETFDLYQKNKDSAASALKREWAEIYEDHSNNPIYSVNPYECEYQQIVLRFDDASHDDNVINWVMKADNKSIFGDTEEKLVKYKSSLIITPIRSSDYVEAKDTTIQLIKVDGFETENAADYLKGFFIKQAKADNLEIKGISESRVIGYNPNVASYQRNGRDALASVYAALDRANNVSAFLSKPVNTEANKTSKIKDLIKYAMAGLVMGLLIGIAVTVIPVIRRNCIISRRQIEENFEIDMLADYSRNDEQSLDVLNANLDLMTKEENRIMVIGLPSEKQEMNPADDWNKRSKRTYEKGYDLSNDPETIDTLQRDDGIVLCIRFGVSKPDDIQRIVLRARVLKKPVLGYVLI